MEREIDYIYKEHDLKRSVCIGRKIGYGFQNKFRETYAL